MQDRYPRNTGRNKTAVPRKKSSGTATRSAGAIGREGLSAATLRLHRADCSPALPGARKSDFISKARSLREALCRVIENEALRIARQHSDCGDTVHESAESAHLLAMTVVFSIPQSTLNYLEELGQINELERQFLTYTIQAVSYVLGMDPVISKSLTRIRRRAKEVAGILANAIGQSCPPPEPSKLFLHSFLTV